MTRRLLRPKVCWLRRAAALLLVATAASGLAAAAARALAQQRDDGECRGRIDLAAAPDLALGRIGKDAGPRAYFLKDGIEQKGCPDSGEACRARAYLVPGDRVILGKKRGAFVCADYVSPKGETRSGWLPSAAVASEPSTRPVAARDWLGTWRRVEATITVRPGPGTGEVSVKGDATYGALDPERVKRGAVNIGEIEASGLRPAGDQISFAMGEDRTMPVDEGDEADCKVWMRRLGPWLLVSDNGFCGGANVRFDGVYMRRP